MEPWRSPLIVASVIAVAAFSLLAAGCGGGASPGVARIASSTTAATTNTQNGTTPAENGTLASALAFARCMRSHGIPGWPDPTSSGVFDKAELRQLGVSESQVRALEQGACNIPLPSGGQTQAQTITPSDQADYRKAVACMRSHGFPDFPDPTFQNNNVTFNNIPSGIDTSSARFESANASCRKLIPAGLPDSGSDAP
jgi:hypothetical protein